MQKMIKYRLHFGRDIKGNDLPITPREFRMFCKQEVDKHFTGYTKFDATGLWKGMPELTFVLEFIVDIFPYGMNKEPDLKEIIDAYKVAFDQESVMLTKEFIEVSF